MVGDSMSPTLTGGEYSGLNIILPGGDYVYADTAATVSRFDIVVITTDNGSGGETTIIKRAIAFGGEEVELDRGVLYIDGREISEPYVSPENNTPGNSYNSFEATVVPDGCLFVLGDNRNVSVDSRDHYGMIDMDDVVGVVGEWSLGLSRLFTPINTFFDFTLPSVFSGCGG